MILGVIAAALAGCAATSEESIFESQPAVEKPATSPSEKAKTTETPMQLGNFSVSLAVKDLAKSRSFYEKLGFTYKGGDGKSWVVLKNDTAIIGLFQGMFDKNMLTFNPGWDREAKTLASFEDVRSIQATLKSRGIEFKTEADPATTGPAHFVIVDPDGNPILLDQHVPKPAK